MIGFLILHYETLEDTLKCIESILALDQIKIPIHIVVVDNGSKDASYEALQQRYTNDAMVTLLSTGKNLGFSAGNNYGYKNFPNREKLELLIVCNSDIIFHQKSFIRKALHLWKEVPFEILGPDIYSYWCCFKVHQSPKRMNHYKITALTGILKKWEEEYKILSGELPNEHPAVRDCLKDRKPWWKQVLSWCKQSLNNHKKEQAFLQGSCLIFSKNYMERYQKLFDPEPFLYFEESFLFLRAQRDGLRICYNPRIKVIHNEQSSIKRMLSDDRRREIFRREQLLKSGYMYLEQCKSGMSD